MSTVTPARPLTIIHWAVRASLAASTLAALAALVLWLLNLAQVQFGLLALLTVAFSVGAWGMWLGNRTALALATPPVEVAVPQVMPLWPPPVAPIGADPVFAWPPVGDARLFLLPKEGEAFDKCQDFYAVNAAEQRYAVTDGVSTSFAPRAWASMVARGAVQAPDVWQDEATFTTWLSAQSLAWRTWMDQRWAPTIQALQEWRGEPRLDYTEQIHAKGAQTTLIYAQLAADASADQVRVQLAAVGDAEALLARPVADGWHLEQAFPLSDPDEFGVQPTTLATVDGDQWRAHAWQHHATETLTAQVGDCLVLCTDTLAEWLLHDPDARLGQLLALATLQDFVQLVVTERQTGQMKDDDMTALIIPIRAIVTAEGASA